MQIINLFGWDTFDVSQRHVLSGQIQTKIQKHPKTIYLLLTNKRSTSIPICPRPVAVAE